mgnify:CR=1 FL=1
MLLDRLQRDGPNLLPEVAPVSMLAMFARQFADFMIEDHGVGVVAGSAFGDRGEGHVRITYAAPDATIDEGMERMAKGLESL